MRHRSVKARRGAAAVEFAVSLPLPLLLMLGVCQTSRIIEVRHLMVTAARDGARQAASGRLTNAEVGQLVRSSLAASSLPSTDAVINVADLDSQSGGSVRNAALGHRVCVQVSIPVEKLMWTGMYMPSKAGSTIQVRSVWAACGGR